MFRFVVCSYIVAELCKKEVVKRTFRFSSTFQILVAPRYKYLKIQKYHTRNSSRYLEQIKFFQYSRFTELKCLLHFSCSKNYFKIQQKLPQKQFEVCRENKILPTQSFLKIEMFVTFDCFNVQYYLGPYNLVYLKNCFKTQKSHQRIIQDTYLQPIKFYQPTSHFTFLVKTVLLTSQKILVTLKITYLKFRNMRTCPKYLQKKIETFLINCFRDSEYFSKVSAF